MPRGRRPATETKVFVVDEGMKKIIKFFMLELNNEGRKVDNDDIDCRVDNLILELWKYQNAVRDFSREVS